jgi:pyruvate-formate lyase-activating enzyme
VSITDHCDYRCPVCYAESGPRERPDFLPVEEILRRVGGLKRRGGRMILLTGGEPTLHPDLPRIVRGVRGLGHRVQLVTNGLRIAQQPELARELKAAGLFKISLQLDSLNEVTHRRQRGNSFVAEKHLAAQAITGSGLRLGTVTTVTTLNLDEIDTILEFGLRHAPRLVSMVFQAAAPAGRFELGRETLVDKEQILTRVLGSPRLGGASLDDVWPLPHFEPWGLRVHPECGVNLIGAVRGKEFVPVSRFLDSERFQERMHRTPARRGWASRNLTPLRHLVASTRAGTRLGLLRDVAGFLVGRGGRSVVLIGVGGFCVEGFIDARRIAGCANAELTQQGPVSPCLWYSGAAAMQRKDLKGGAP